MRAFVINLDAATDRWTFMQKSFAGSQLTLTRVPAVNAAQLSLPHPDYAERLYHLFHGRATNLRELACYLSHLRAMEMFLATGEEHAVIAEDDLVLRPDFDAVLECGLRHAGHWNILRLSGLKTGHPVTLARLDAKHRLCANLGRLKGAAAYLLDRRAARALLTRLLPMRLPYDHALDREWRWGLHAAYILPFPASQTESEFLSSVQPGTYPKRSRLQRSLTTYPYQAANELSRWLHRGAHALWLRARFHGRPV